LNEDEINITIKRAEYKQTRTKTYNKENPENHKFFSLSFQYKPKIVSTI